MSDSGGHRGQSWQAPNPPPPQQAPYWAAQTPPARPSTGLSTAALVLGILGTLAGLVPLLFFVAFPLGVLALVMGLIAYSRGRRAGVPMGRAGSILGGIAIALSIVGLVIVNDAFEDLDDDEPSADAPTAGGEVFAVGETAHTGDFDVIVHTVEDPYQPVNEFEAAPAGQRLVGVEVSVTNTSNEVEVMSTLAGTELFDSQDRAWDIVIAGTDRPQLNGDVLPGQTRRGWVVFAVADDATGLRLRIQGNVTATGSVFELG